MLTAVTSTLQRYTKFPNYATLTTKLVEVSAAECTRSGGFRAFRAFCVGQKNNQRDETDETDGRALHVRWYRKKNSLISEIALTKKINAMKQMKRRWLNC